MLYKATFMPFPILYLEFHVRYGLVCIGSIVYMQDIQQVVSSGARIFTGAECVKWFMKNMVGVTSMQVAQVSVSVR